MSHVFHDVPNRAHEAANFPPAPKPQPVRGYQLAAEGKIEERLHDLGNEIQELVEAPYPGLLQDRGYVREALEELASKHTTLLWTARVAKCTEGFVRERLWWGIDKALTSLEKIAGSLVES
ncbi:MAG TPA: hypothetical protein VK757_02000 [Candidatus Acidoferrum sp.]|jgi:hypothetical protein|nr:hypothetical protein [Candidatus Acidoferrum sp.]